MSAETEFILKVLWYDWILLSSIGFVYMLVYWKPKENLSFSIRKLMNLPEPHILVAIIGALTVGTLLGMGAMAVHYENTYTEDGKYAFTAIHKSLLDGKPNNTERHNHCRDLGYDVELNDVYNVEGFGSESYTILCYKKPYGLW